MRPGWREAPRYGKKGLPVAEHRAASYNPIPLEIERLP